MGRGSAFFHATGSRAGGVLGVPRGGLHRPAARADTPSDTGLDLAALAVAQSPGRGAPRLRGLR